ncbi:sialidase family protein [Microbispora sp. ZYX-F-249]|uniref:exo-alpha-sialidase n=1 Tax=Microbispora maris TaxID=3144104 RepID=A0ABV0AX37_9ACTN
MTDPVIGRRAFTLGIVAGTAAPAAATGLAEPFFEEATLWDSSTGTLANYHVHGLTVLRDDTILAFEGRHEVCDAGPRDLLLRRSTDQGRTWSPTQVVVPSVEGQSWGNPALVHDRTTGEVFLFSNLSERLPENTSCSGDTGSLLRDLQHRRRAHLGSAARARRPVRPL